MENLYFYGRDFKFFLLIEVIKYTRIRGNTMKLIQRIHLIP